MLLVKRPEADEISGINHTNKAKRATIYLSEGIREGLISKEDNLKKYTKIIVHHLNLSSRIGYNMAERIKGWMKNARNIRNYIQDRILWN